MAAHPVEVPRLATRVTLSSLRAATGIVCVSPSTTFCTQFESCLTRLSFTWSCFCLSHHLPYSLARHPGPSALRVLTPPQQLQGQAHALVSGHALSTVSFRVVLTGVVYHLDPYKIVNVVAKLAHCRSHTFPFCLTVLAEHMTFIRSVVSRSEIRCYFSSLVLAVIFSLGQLSKS